jgi:hypothetical protein
MFLLNNKFHSIQLIILILFCSCPQSYAKQPNINSPYTVLNASEYRQTVNMTRQRVTTLINSLQPYRSQSLNAQVAFIAQQLADIPYSDDDHIGEGDWQPTSRIYRPGAVHINQYPVYRLDRLDCQTFVEVAMALLYANHLNQFDSYLLQIAYGAAGNPQQEIVHAYNRNHFIDADFNPINQHHGWLTDVTAQGGLANDSKTASATITRQQWFLQQQVNKNKVRVLNQADGPAMVDRLTTVYQQLNDPRFQQEKITIAYLPKQTLAVAQTDDTGLVAYQPNHALLDQLPTPAIIEMIMDPTIWANGKNIKYYIGSETTVAHLGLIYRQTFRFGEVIYQKINCDYRGNKKMCTVMPVTCQQTTCRELMFAHATNIYPDGYAWQRKKDGGYACVASTNKTLYEKKCNRVMQLPLFDYLTEYQYGKYVHMDNPAMLGVHVEMFTPHPPLRVGLSHKGRGKNGFAKS